MQKNKTNSQAKKKKPVNAKKQTAKKVTKKTTAKKKKTAVATKRKTTSAAKKKKSTKKVVRKKTAVKKETPELLTEQLHVFPKKRTLINQLPIIDLDQLSTSAMKTKQVPESVERVAIHSRLAFYLGVFMGAIVVNAFLVTILAVMSV